MNLTQAKVSADEFRHVMGHFATGVTVITANKRGTPVGTTASAVSSLSLEPPMILVCLHETSETGIAIAETDRFAVNILTRQQAKLASRLATKDPEKFSAVEFGAGIGGVPVLTEALAYVECETVERARGGTHVVFIARVLDAKAGTGEPLAYFRGRFGRIDLDLEDDSP